LSLKPLKSVPVGVVVQRSKAASQWIDFTWKPLHVLPGVPETAPWTKLSDDGEVATFYAGSADVEFYPSATGQYRDNLMSGTPLLWVALRPTGDEPPYRLRERGAGRCVGPLHQQHDRLGQPRGPLAAFGYDGPLALRDLGSDRNEIG
jgi:hypothetical protein